jgi:hypothetical protein
VLENLGGLRTQTEVYFVSMHNDLRCREVASAAFKTSFFGKCRSAEVEINPGRQLSAGHVFSMFRAR